MDRGKEVGQMDYKKNMILNFA